MNSAERRKVIVDFLENKGACTYQELQALLKVTGMTVRRDVDTLAQNGALIKVLGGVQSARAPLELYESQLRERLLMHSREKQAISRKALELINPGETIYLDGSTTCLELARLLAKFLKKVTIVTNSFLICQKATSCGGNLGLLIGGQYDPETFCFAGAISEDQAKKYFVDKAFLSTKGFVPNEGTYEASVGMFRIKQIIAGQSSEVILLVDHSKFGQRSLCKVLDISQINTVITDDSIIPAEITALEESGKTVLVASAQSQEQEALKNAT